MRPRLHLVPNAPVGADTECLRRVATGDVAALGDVYDRHAPALRRFAARATNPGDADDLVQSTFLTVVRIAGTYDGRTDTARPWLFGILARQIRQRKRSVARFARAILRMHTGASATTDSRDPVATDLERGLRKLSDAKRIVIVLAEVEGYSCPEIADILDVPVGTVWTRLHHARKELRAYIDEGGAR